MSKRILTCQRCTSHFEAQRSDAKWCPRCRPLVHKDAERHFEKRHRHTCPDCGVEISRTSDHCRVCGSKVGGQKRSGPNHRDWKGGRHIDKYGYVHILVASSGNTAHRYRPEHHLVWEKANGKRLPQGWIVHHLNGIKDDNRPDNLAAVSRSEHNHRHGERRIRELEAKIARLQEQLDGLLHTQIPP